MALARWIPLIWLFAALVSILVAGWAVLWRGMNLTRNALGIQSAFDALSFDTPLGPRTGDELLVVKVTQWVDDEAAYARLDRPRSGPARWDSLWYAKGPGPSYFLAICTWNAARPDAPPRWTVRSLDEEAMRTALVDDPQAWMLACDEAVLA